MPAFKIGDTVPNYVGLPITIEGIEADHYIGPFGGRWVETVADDGTIHLYPAIELVAQSTNGAARPSGTPKETAQIELANPPRFKAGDSVNIVIKGILHTLEPAIVNKVTSPVLGIWGYALELADGSIDYKPETHLQPAESDPPDEKPSDPAEGDETETGELIETPKPLIIVNDRHLSEISGDAYTVLLADNDPPHVFQYGGALARVTSGDGRSAVQLLDAAMLRYRLERVARFVNFRVSKTGPYSQPANAPDRLIADILAYPDWPGIPTLQGVVTAPVVRRGGDIRVKPGYDPITQLYYHAVGRLRVGATTPTTKRVAWAVNLILIDLLGDFPFKDEASRANTIGMLILPFVRQLIEGCTPLHTLNAPTPGTGKTLLGRVATLPFNPDGPVVMTAGQDEDEWRKRITSLLGGGASHILIDNIKGGLVSGSLAAVLSTSYWTDRILGKSQTITLPNRAVWIATGNNIMVDSELARRSVWIRLDSNAEKPWTRNGFKHASLTEWTLQHRAKLITAVLTIIRHWFKAGCPTGTKTVGGFESWARVIGGILDAAHIPGFMENANELYEQSDPAAALWAAFVAEWARQFGENPVGVKDLFPLADSEPGDNLTGLGLLDTMLAAPTARARKIRLGRLLGERKDMVIDGFKIEEAGERKRASQYRLKRLGG
jgi:putative DNA primase/helicase